MREGGRVTQGLLRYSQRVSTLTEQQQHRIVLFSYRPSTQPSVLLNVYHTYLRAARYPALADTRWLSAGWVLKKAGDDFCLSLSFCYDSRRQFEGLSFVHQDKCLLQYLLLGLFHNNFALPHHQGRGRACVWWDNGSQLTEEGWPSCSPASMFDNWRENRSAVE